MPKIRLFIASPSDVATERAKVDKVVETLQPTAKHLNLELEIVKWENAVPDMGRPQQVIFDQLKPTEWDLFIGILWHRFGSPPGGKDDKGREFKSGTEEEFHAAYKLWQEHQRPRMMIYRCKRNPSLDDLDPDQFKKVKEFFSEFAPKGEHAGLYKEFTTAKDFERKLTRDLQEVFIAYAKKSGQNSKTAPPPIQKDAPPNHLPRRQAFFGRKNEMARVLGALDPAERTWGVVIDGIGGIGKTALALEAAHRAKDAGIFDAFLFITAKERHLATKGIVEDNPAARTLDDFLNQTARQLGETGIPNLEHGQKITALYEALRKMSTLLVYDNLETLRAKDQEALADFLRFLPEGSKAILTSRRRGGEGALWLRLDKLSWETAREIIESHAKNDANLHRKLEKAGEKRWKELYKESNGSPLALNHILGLMRLRRTLSVKGAIKLLREGGDEDILEFVFREAKKELDESDNTALTALALFEPSAPYDALLDVADLSRNALDMSLDRLDALSLLADAGEDRYALHPLTRKYADELSVEFSSVRERFATYWLSFAQKHQQDESILLGEIANLSKVEKYFFENLSVKRAGQIINMANILSMPLFSADKWEHSIRLLSLGYEASLLKENRESALSFAHNITWIYKRIGQQEAIIEWNEKIQELYKHEEIKIFISYAHEDKNKVLPIYKALVNEGFSPWMDTENLLGGQDWKKEIEKVMDESHVIVACLSNTSINKKGFVQKEVKRALDILDSYPEGEIFLIPVRLEECEVKTSINKLHWVDIFKPDGFEMLIKSIKIATKHN